MDLARFSKFLNEIAQPTISDCPHQSHQCFVCPSMSNVYKGLSNTFNKSGKEMNHDGVAFGSNVVEGLEGWKELLNGLQVR